MREYRTLQGDTWDIIAYREYRDEKLMSVLIMKNSEYADIIKFPAGIILKVPEIPSEEINTLPPWKV